MSLGQLLVGDIESAIGPGGEGTTRYVLLWFDEARQWERVVAALSPLLAIGGIDLFTLDQSGSQVEAKLRLLSRSSDARVVAYLPGWLPVHLQPDGDTQPSLWSLVDYAYTGVVWSAVGGNTIGSTADWLARHGLKLAGGAPGRKRLLDGTRDSRLSKWLAREVGREISDLPDPIRESDIAEALGGDPASALRETMLDPDRAVSTWAEDIGEVLERIRDRFGIRVDPKQLPEDLADSVAADLALAEAWDAFDRAPDFPFIARLPDSEARRTAVISLVRKDLLVHGDVAPAFLKRVHEQELGLHELTTWSADRDGHPLALPQLGYARWLLAIERIADAFRGGWRETTSHLELGKLGPGGPVWNVPGLPYASWEGLRRLGALVGRAAGAIDLAKTLALDPMIEAYVDDWWHLDDDYLAFRREADRHPPLARVRAVADDAYTEFLEASAGRWTTGLESNPAWKSAISSVAQISPDIWSPAAGPRATLIIDAVRWDVAKCLQERLGPDCRLTPVLSTL